MTLPFVLIFAIHNSCTISPSFYLISSIYTCLPSTPRGLVKRILFVIHTRLKKGAISTRPFWLLFFFNFEWVLSHHASCLFCLVIWNEFFFYNCTMHKRGVSRANLSIPIERSFNVKIGNSSRVFFVIFICSFYGLLKYARRVPLSKLFRSWLLSN